MPIIGLLGMPGAGKTTAMNSVSNNPDFEGLQMKEIARKEYTTVTENGVEELPENIVSQARESDRVNELRVTGNFEEEISDWVDTVLDFDNTYFANCASEFLQNQDLEETTWIIDGIRTVADVNNVLEAPTEVHLVYIYTPFYLRAERVAERGRAGEETALDLMDRDEQEFEWGLEDILTQFELEQFVATHDSVNEFETDFQEFVSKLSN